MKELRVILLDEKTKNVEFNELMDVENYSVPEDSRFLYEYKKEGIMTTVGKKILYALANSEELIQDIVTLPGAEMITELDSLKLTDGTGNFPFSNMARFLSLRARSTSRFRWITEWRILSLGPRMSTSRK